MNPYRMSSPPDHDACGIGAVVNIDGKKEYRTLDDALRIVEKLEHRAGKDATGEVGDGVGVLLQISHDFFSRAAEESGIELREARGSRGFRSVRACGCGHAEPARALSDGVRAGGQAWGTPYVRDSKYEARQIRRREAHKADGGGGG